MSNDSFVHLKCYSEYSIRDGIVRVDALINCVKENGMSAVAISDHVNLFALVKFYRKAISSGVKPIIAADFWLRDGSEQYKLSCYCQNDVGYKNLTRLISRAYVEGQINEMPTIQWEWLTEYADGLLVLSGGRQGDVGMALLANNKSLAEIRLEKWKNCFPNRFYLELQRTEREGEEAYIHAAIRLAEQHQVPVVATNDVCFLAADDFDAHEARVCIHSGYVLEDHRRPKNYSPKQYFRSTQEMIELFSDIPEAIENTVEIAKRCTLELTLGKPFLPDFPVPESITLENYLEQKARDGLDVYFGRRTSITDEQHPEYYDRLRLELDVINTMGFPGYFLIVADFINWAKQQDIPVGPGRGSGAGSLVAFALGITELDPIEHDLLFERFLNPERVSMPDFDIDFCMERRDEVIDYVAQRYGRESVSQIITYGTMAAKAVVRDVGRVLGMPYGYVDKIAKLIPFELGMTLKKALADEAQLAQRYHDEEEVGTLIDLAMKLEGITRNAGKHAGGVVIAPTKLTDFTPLYCEPDGKNVVTQFDKDDVEAVGLVKFDFLGLRTLTIIHWAIQSIKDDVDISRIPLDDEKTYDLLRSCATTAVFQLESRGMKELIRRLQPDCFEDITALVALFRPGPLQSGMVDDYIDRKHGRSVVEYSHPDLEPILRTTNGVILYQEQVMEIARSLAGYSLGGADILRRAMGKKKPEEMARQREVFIEGASGRGIDESVSGHIFDLMEKFAGYGFNKSHSAAYALISYQTAWLKAHYPAEFMAAVLSSDMDNTDKVVLFLNECRQMELVVNPPNINVSQFAFAVDQNQSIQYGLGAIKGAGEAAIQNILAERQQNGAFKDLFDLCSRVDSRKVNKRVIEAFIASGSMDGFGQPRAVLSATLEKAMKYAEQHQRNEAIGQVDLFGEAQTKNSSDISYAIADSWSDARRLQGEKETLGYYLSGHPLQAYESEFNRFISVSLSDLSQCLRKEAVIAGMITQVRVMNTKKGRRMAILSLEDCTGQTEVTIFSKLYDTVFSQLQKDAIVIIKGKIEEDGYSGGFRVVAESLENLTQVRLRLVKSLMIKVQDPAIITKLLDQLTGLVGPHLGGSCPIVIQYQIDTAAAELQLGEDWRVTPSDELMTELKSLCGQGAVGLVY